MPVEITDWSGLLRNRRTDESDLMMEAPIRQSAAGGSGSFLAAASDKRQYWVKVLNNPQHPRVVVNEQIVGRACSLLGDLVPSVRTIRIPPELVGWEFRPNCRLEAGIAHASLAIDNAMETRQLDHQEKDDNRRHHSTYLALYDWCWGGDAQWLMDMAADQRYYAHDNGHYFPNGPGWDEASLLANVDIDHTHPYGGPSFDAATLEELAQRLETVRREDLIAMISVIPSSWPVTDDELAVMGYFLERRAPQAAARIRTRPASNTP